MLKLKRLKINRFRNVRPGCELVFSDRVNVLLGPNGSGKTSLLDLISSVLRMQLPAEELSVEFELAAGEVSFAGTISTTAPDQLPDIKSWPAKLPRPAPSHDVDLTIRLPAPKEPITLSYRDGMIEMNLRGSKGEPVRTRAQKTFGIMVFAFISLSRYDIASINELGDAFRLDESLDVFRAITARSDAGTQIVSGELRPSIGVLVAAGPPSTGLSSATGGMVPATMLAAVQQVASNTVSDIVVSDRDLPFLAEAVRMLGLREAEAKVELMEKDAQGGGGYLQFGNFAFRFTRRDGSVFLDHQLSYGQKRLLAFLYYLDANPSFVIADELVNGLHHAWIEACMQAIGERQAFLTSQNPLLLDYLWFESVEQVKASFILCRTEQLRDREEMVWRNMTDDEAAMFYSAYQVGVEHVGEILRTRALW